jgi:putative transposase
LAVILDVFFRTAIGYAISRNLETPLTLTALRMAIEHGNPLPGCIHHSDRCVQHASKDYVKKLAVIQFKISMSLKGNPSDNAYAEERYKNPEIGGTKFLSWLHITSQFVHLFLSKSS